MKNDINSSEYLHKIKGVEFSPAPYFDLQEEFHMQQLILKLIKNKLIVSAHDISEGGLVITLFESAFYKGLGFNVKNVLSDIRKDAYWFGEAQGRVVVSVGKAFNEHFLQFMKAQAVPFFNIGEVAHSQIVVDDENWEFIDYWKSLYNNAIANMLKRSK
jgi:phosphoribosylformylglycinamidine synthase